MEPPWNDNSYRISYENFDVIRLVAGYRISCMNYDVIIQIQLIAINDPQPSTGQSVNIMSSC